MNYFGILMSFVRNYADLTRHYPEIINKLDITYETIQGRFPQMLKFNLYGARFEFASPGTIPLVYIYKEIFRDLCYLAPSWNISDCFGLNKIVVDLGANIGLFSLLAASQGCTVYAVEANPCNFAYLLDNITRNKQDRVFPFNFAVSGQSGIQELHVAGQWSGSSLISSQSIGNRFSTPVRGKKLADFLNEIGAPEIDFLKMDCEGCEYEVLLNCGSHALSKVKKISLEFHIGSFAYSPTDICKHLDANGFRTIIEQTPQASFGYIKGSR